MKEEIFSNYIMNIWGGGDTCELFYVIGLHLTKAIFFLTIYFILTILAFILYIKFKKLLPFLIFEKQKAT